MPSAFSLAKMRGPPSNRYSTTLPRPGPISPHHHPRWSGDGTEDGALMEKIMALRFPDPRRVNTGSRANTH